ncbi:MAG TPA: pyridoxal-dependent decarboxylase [Thermoleophilaceae bacterium]|jgi:aromatic-L-amino-acid/L-tryptophan decarboxylase|nr:pyridoxal-dependent decarboxylase [Thermoleophilaceae bacterium]
MAERPEPVPDLDWDPARARELGDEVVELWTELLARLPDLPVGGGFTAQRVREELDLNVPEEGLSNAELVARLRALVFDQSIYPGHPGFFAYISGAGTVPGAAADLIASALNQNLGGFRLSPGANQVEAALVDWLAESFGLPDGAGGQVVAGGAMANFVGLKVARDRALSPDGRSHGLAGGPPLAFYASSESHVVQRRAADMLGLGLDAVRTVAVDDGLRMRPDALAEAIERDLAQDVRPAAVIGTAGTTATGAIDPLGPLADICERHDVHFHVDACYGGPAVLADDLRPLLRGIERADSIAADAHKWLYTPLLGGCALARDEAHLAAAFAADASYIWLDEEVRSQHGVDYVHQGPDFSRGFAALRIWLSLVAHGRAAYGRRISHDAALARYLGELVEEHPDFELMCPVGLSICCLRYVPQELRGQDEALDRLNERIMMGVQEDGRVFCSNAVIGGRFGLRACIVNFRTEAEHVERLLEVAEELGRAELGS